MTDPDDGVNVKRKLQTTAKHRDSFDDALLQSIPPAKDACWTKALYKAPKVTFTTIYKFLVNCNRKVLLKKADHVENTVERRQNYMTKKVSEHNGSNSSDAFESITYTRTLDKAYRFLLFLSGWPYPKC